MHLAMLLRFGAAELFLEVKQILRRRSAKATTGRDTYITLLALGLREATQKFDRQAADADLQTYLPHRPASDDVLLLPLPVVIGQAQQHRFTMSGAGLLRRAARTIGYLFDGAV
jgi:hypothetical protein